MQSKTGLLCLKHQPIILLQLQSLKAFTFRSTGLKLILSCSLEKLFSEVQPAYAISSNPKPALC